MRDLDATDLSTSPEEADIEPRPRTRRTWTVSSTSFRFQSIRTPAGRPISTTGRPTPSGISSSPLPEEVNEAILDEAFVIGICGGSASGKTTVAKKIIQELDVPWVTLLSMDSFYKVLTLKQHEQANRNDYNFDHPDAFDFELVSETLQKLKEGKKVEVPVYDFVSHSRREETITMNAANVIIFEGILAFHDKKILDMLDMKIFVDTDSDERLCRRIKRDISERGREVFDVLEQYQRFVKPAFDQFIFPSMVHSDIIVPRGGENKVAIDLIVHHVKTHLDKRMRNIVNGQ